MSEAKFTVYNGHIVRLEKGKNFQELKQIRHDKVAVMLNEMEAALEAFVNNSSVAVNQPYEHEKAEAALKKARGE